MRQAPRRGSADGATRRRHAPVKKLPYKTVANPDRRLCRPPVSTPRGHRALWLLTRRGHLVPLVANAVNYGIAQLHSRQIADVPAQADAPQCEHSSGARHPRACLCLIVRTLTLAVALHVAPSLVAKLIATDVRLGLLTCPAPPGVQLTGRHNFPELSLLLQYLVNARADTRAAWLREAFLLSGAR